MTLMKAVQRTTAQSAQFQFCEFSLVQMRMLGVTWGSLAEGQMECGGIRFHRSSSPP
jgi:hypothetical protein